MAQVVMVVPEPVRMVVVVMPMPVVIVRVVMPIMSGVMSGVGRGHVKSVSANAHMVTKGKSTRRQETHGGDRMMGTTHDAIGREAGVR